MDAVTASFLADTLRPYNPNIPKAYDPSIYQNQGFNVANQIDGQLEAGQKMAATDQATALAAAQAPYNLALLQAKTDAIPLDKKYNQAVQSAQIQNYQAQADQRSALAGQAKAKTDALNKPFNPPPFTFNYSGGAADAPAPAAAYPPQASTSADDNDDDSGDDMPDVSANTGYSGTPQAPISNVSAPDADGFHSTVGTTFATPSDLKDFAKNKSLATGDNGVGAWGDDTTANTPFVALPPSFLKAHGIDPDQARGTPVTVQANGRTVQAVVGDKMPDHSSNGAGIDMNPATAAGLGIADVDDFKGHVQFKLGHDDTSDTPAASVASAPIPGTTDDADLDSILGGPLVAVSGAYQPGDPGYVDPATTTGGPRVPTSQGEADALRAAFNQYAASQAGNPDPRMKAYLAGYSNRIEATIRQFKSNRSFAARQTRAAGAVPLPSALTATDPGTGLPVLNGFVPDKPTVNAKGQVQYGLLSPNDVASEKQDDHDAAIERLQKLVGSNAHGATLDDLLQDRGNYQDAVVDPDAVRADGTPLTKAGKVTPGVHYYMQSVYNPKTQQNEMREMPMAESQYQTYRKKMAALGYGTGGDDAAASPAAAPTFMMSHMLGANGTVTPDVPTAASTPVPAAEVPPATDPTIRLQALQTAARLAPQQKQQDIDDEDFATQQAIKEDQAPDKKANAATVANNFDYSVFQGKPSTSNWLNPDNDPSGTSTRFVLQKLKEAADSAGVKEFDQKAALKLIKQKRDQAALDALLPTVDPDVLDSANILAARAQARQSSLPTGFGTSSVGATDRIIPNSGTR